MKRLIPYLTGMVAGGLLVGIGGAVLMPSMMLSVHPSQYGFVETVARLQDESGRHGWKVSKVYDIQQSLRQAGHADMTRASILSICQPHHAHRILREDANKKVLAVMPCRVGVYEGQDGRTYVTSMNIGLMGRLFGGTIAQVMGVAGAEEARILSVVTEAGAAPAPTRSGAGEPAPRPTGAPATSLPASSPGKAAPTPAATPACGLSSSAGQPAGLTPPATPRAG